MIQYICQLHLVIVLLVLNAMFCNYNRANLLKIYQHQPIFFVVMTVMKWRVDFEGVVLVFLNLYLNAFPMFQAVKEEEIFYFLLFNIQLIQNLSKIVSYLFLFLQIRRNQIM